MYISKGQALQFNWLFEKGAFVLLPDQTFSVDFDKVFFLKDFLFLKLGSDIEKITYPLIFVDPS